MSEEVKRFTINGRTGSYAPLDNGMYKFLFDDGEVMIAVPQKDLKRDAK